MPSQKYAFRKGEPKDLIISTPIFSQTHSVSLNGKELGSISGDQLKTGWSCKINRGVLTIQKGKGVAASKLDVRLNGEPLPESSADPQLRLSVVMQIIYFIAAINVGVGLLTAFSDVRLLGVTAADSFPLILTGIIYGVLGFFVSRRSSIALGLTIGGFGIDTLFTVLGIFEVAASGGRVAGGLVGGLVTRAIFFYYMFHGFSAIRELNTKQDQAEEEAEEEFTPSWSQDNKTQSFFEPEGKPRKASAAPKKTNKLSQVEMILVGVVVVLVVVVVGLVAVALSSNNAAVEAASLPTLAVIPTQRPTLSASPTPSPTPFPHGTILEMPRDTIDVAYSLSLARMVAVADDRDMLADDVLYLYDPLTQTESTMPTCQRMPANLVLDAYGGIAAIGYKGGVCVIDLLRQTIMKDYVIDANYTVANQTIANGWLYFSLQDDYNGLHGLHALNLNQPLSGSTHVDYTGASPFSLAGNTLYMPLPYEDFKMHVWDIAGGWPSRKHEWEFSESYNVCSQSWVSADDRYLFNRCGQVFEMSANGNLPAYTDHLTIEDERFGVSIGHLLDVPAAGRIIVLGSRSTASTCSDAVYIYYRNTFDLQSHYPLDSGSCAEQIFMDRDGVHYYITIDKSSIQDTSPTRFIIGNLSRS
ncbi:MAG: hypothetical protein K8L97_04700 [Anaerolineae bacterium]|nr:hypothetical protein [Anaerolineae bacterium]